MPNKSLPELDSCSDSLKNRIGTANPVDLEKMYPKAFRRMKSTGAMPKSTFTNI
jgi:hypothetical protein